MALIVHDRAIRHELLRSSAFIDLPSDTDRLLLVGLNLLADDFGNLEANVRRLARWACHFTDLKTPEAVAATLVGLKAAGLVRGYEAGGKAYLNLRDFRNRRTYTRRQCPPSPWCDADVRTGAHVAGMRPRGGTAAVVVMAPKENSRGIDPDGLQSGSTENTPQINAPAAKPDSDLAQKCHQERRAEEVPNAPKLPALAPCRPAAWSLPEEWARWAVAYWADQRRPLNSDQVRALGEKFHDYWRARPSEAEANGRLNSFAEWRIWVFRHLGPREVSARSRETV